VLLVLVPVAIIGEFLHWPATVLFILSGLGVVPLAGMMGTATEELAHHVGPRVGGLMNATLGNAAELIITIFAIRAGLLELVLASITGSILGNLLLVMGLSLLVGGIRHGRQVFDRHTAGMNSTMTLLAVAGLVVPSLFIADIAAQTGSTAANEALSIGPAALLILIYALNIIYDFTRETGTDPEQFDPVHTPAMAKGPAVAFLLVATAGIAWLSEILVGSVEAAGESLHLSEFFIGIIIVPLVGNVAEHFVAVTTAAKNKMELSMAISLGSSLQIALFVAPLLVFISLLFGHHLQLTFNRFEVEALLATAVVAAFIAQDGESNWLEGAILLVLYALLAVAFFYVR
jgi:Ca2+:H+ antiporter